MSKVIIKDEKQLLKFLSVLAEEVVQQAYADVGGKSQQQQVAQDIKASKRQFIEEEDPPSAGEKPASQEAPAAGADSKSKDAMSISPKFDSLVDAINALRGAPSLRDSTVETQLRAYYDKLGDAEAASAILFFRIISQVMKGEIEGASAPDPGNYQIVTTMEDGEDLSPEAPETAAPSVPVEKGTVEPEEPEPEESETAGTEPEESEDTAPPIKVGASPVTEAYRTKIRRLLTRS